MPIDYTIDRHEGLILTVAVGTLTDEDIVDMKRRLLADPDYDPGMKELSDIRGVDDFQVTAAGISRFVGIDEVKSEVVKDHLLAIVASRDVIYGMARMYQSQTQSFKPGVEIFRTMEEAREWLGLPSQD
ncbi:MAG: hypothetical protein C4534_03215 [Gaiellales bacterium]|nr:MAG: hypothetical protein C4534_03215 [Gaiellales bacterium]